MDKKKFSSMLLIAPLAAGALFLGACSSNSSDSAGESSSASASESATQAASDSIKIEDAWVGTTDQTASTMTGVFGTIKNDSDREIELKDVKTVSIDGEKEKVTTELHETETDNSGQEEMKKIDSIKVPANGQITLEPGKDHIMLMDLQKSISAGTEVELEMKAKNDPGEKKIEFKATARDAAQEYGANEETGAEGQASVDATESGSTQEGEQTPPPAPADDSQQNQDQNNGQNQDQNNQDQQNQDQNNGQNSDGSPQP